MSANTNVNTNVNIFYQSSDIKVPPPQKEQMIDYKDYLNNHVLELKFNYLKQRDICCSPNSTCSETMAACCYHMGNCASCPFECVNLCVNCVKSCVSCPCYWCSACFSKKYKKEEQFCVFSFYANEKWRYAFLTPIKPTISYIFSTHTNIKIPISRNFLFYLVILTYIQFPIHRIRVFIVIHEPLLYMLFNYIQY